MPWEFRKDVTGPKGDPGDPGTSGRVVGGQEYFDAVRASGGTHPLISSIFDIRGFEEAGSDSKGLWIQWRYGYYSGSVVNPVWNEGPWPT
ncbi:MAG: hypothetical protein F4X97_02310 [Boseongicola sp. SB0662_bin_57]|nr:hypothetical protein [Boseongicola sp. SB0662_bin_57]